MASSLKPTRSAWFRVVTLLAAGSGSATIGIWAMSLAFPVEMLDASSRPLGAVIAGLCALTAMIAVQSYFNGVSESADFVRHEIEVDKLTGYHTRVAMIPQLARAALKADREGASVTLVDIEILRFKSLNDSIGYQRGDQLIVGFAKRIQGIMGEADVVGRIGAGEFAILVDTSKLEVPLEIWLDRMMEELMEPYEVENNRQAISVAAGVVEAIEQYDDPLSVLRKANLALQRGRALGRGAWSVFQPQMGQVAEFRRWVETELPTALENGDFEVHYQPQIDMRSSKPVGYEALLRWRHPQRGLISPMDFVPVAEETGLITQLGRWVMRQACRDAQHFPPECFVAVNLSPVQFMMDDIVKVVREAIDDTGIAPQRLELEITESVMMQDKQKASLILTRLAEMGVSVAVDDFGTGYSNLGYLADFPLTKLKIDRSFVRRIGTDSSSDAIVSTIVGLSRALGVRATAEGVETENQAILLQAAGCEIVQGFYFGRPSPLDSLETQANLTATMH